MADEKVSWLKKISGLKKLIRSVGPLWPDSTELSGFGTDGPYSCSNCEYLKGIKIGKVFRDIDGYARCEHSVVIADPEVEKDERGIPIIRIPEKTCCEFVEPPKKSKLVQIQNKS